MNPFLVLDFHLSDEHLFGGLGDSTCLDSTVDTASSFGDGSDLNSTSSSHQNLLCNDNTNNNNNTNNYQTGTGTEKESIVSSSCGAGEEYDMESGTTAPISCDSCRSNHRRCDRLRPSCQACKLRGISCNYSMNFKRRAKFINNNRLKDEDSAILDCYYTESGYHMVSREELEHFLLESYKSNNNSTNQKQREMFALYYSIKATVECQMGNLEKSELSAKQAKEYLAKVFDSYTSLKVAGTYLNMCFYELWFERLHTAKFYFQTLLFFKEALESSNEEETNVIKENLILSIVYLEKTIFNNDDKKNLHERTFERFLITLPQLFSYLNSFDCRLLGNDWDYYLKNPHLIDSSNCIQVNTVLQNLLRECKRYEQKTFCSSPVLDLYYDVVESGCTLALLSKSEEMNSMLDYVLERSASCIVNSINNPKFESLPFEILLHISFAAEYHLKKVRQGIFIGNMSNCDYIEMLRTELKAYQILQSRYKIAKYYFYGGVFKKLDTYFSEQ